MNRFSTHDRRRLIGERVYQERVLRRLTQLQVSRRIATTFGESNSVSQKRLSAIENGKAKCLDVVELGLIADSLNLPITKFTNP